MTLEYWAKKRFETKDSQAKALVLSPVRLRAQVCPVDPRQCCQSITYMEDGKQIFFFYYFLLFIYLFLAVLGFVAVRAFLELWRVGPTLVAVCRLLVVMDSLAAEQSSWARGLQ